jgi:hypothetical protein
MSKEPTAMTPLKKLSRKDGNPHHKTLLRQIRNFWTPASVGEAKWFAEECYGRAEALASVLSEYTWDDRQVSCSDLREALEVLDDLLYLGYGMLEWWDDEDTLIEHGWQPPKTKESQPRRHRTSPPSSISPTF